MTDQSPLPHGPRQGPDPDPLDEFVTQLLDCGGVLSQIIASMVEFQASGRTTPDEVPTPELAHSLVRGVVGELAVRYPADVLRACARIIQEATDAMCDDLFVLGPDLN